MEQTLVVLGIFILGWCIGYMFGNAFGDGKEKNTADIEGRLANHIKPRYYGYGGGFDTITRCNKCGLTGLYEDLHPVKPCPKCGSKVEEFGSGKWSEIDRIGQWIKPEHNR